ncbi:hypothetical protein GCM10023149_46980 [Mucilaginibacter gynuensis]|uniref:Uncharacterized protein n=1 Tax=Mucilaginibacter gynuensis TaxID=1302236 RepID=A0ABP8HD44_9SPHI
MYDSREEGSIGENAVSGWLSNTKVWLIAILQPMCVVKEVVTIAANKSNPHVLVK